MNNVRDLIRRKGSQVFSIKPKDSRVRCHEDDGRKQYRCAIGHGSG